jgi:cysteine desulfurase
MKQPIYFDYAATTPADPRVAEKMMQCLTPDGNFGNAASRSHMYGWRAEEAIENGRAQVAELINADPREIVWTSGATESNNLAIKGAAHFYHGKGKHIVTSSIEHKAVLDTCRQLEREGYEVTYLDPDSDGLTSIASIEAALRDDTIIVSIMHANNEIGVINDIAAIGELTRSRKIIFHVDAAQSVGKVPVDMEAMKVDLLSMSAHKMYGPKGIGALFVRRKPRVRIEAQIHGGGHERGMRSGTLPTHQIVGFGEAARVANEEMTQEAQRIIALRERLWQGFCDMEEVYLNGHATQRLPGALNVSFNFVEGESLIMALKDLALSSGSACTSASLEPSYVLRALGRSDELAHSSLRFSIGRFTTEENIDQAIVSVRTAVEKLRELSPLWDMYKDGVDLDSVQWAAH